ncbi:microsomal triglyceride transfer protein large subunit [Kryptolebias marmoratus]|uniref:Microsomal triglyceride transfer protein n=1 Tax=Kryptolebias marmoratus TaxID=37003 RepID=A0A3Q3EDB5_KRYMA|nr:microsomal triglyceride transfer protein large subunit [Kryptolebias marmoratus]XP_037830553.1 microsomal triglyceride transfer protein large subunit [Kryptolebias marmoratus]
MLALVVFLLCAASSVSASTKGVAAGPRLNNNQLYKFSYTTEVLLDRVRRSREGSVGYRISSDVNVNLVWRDPGSKDDQLIQLAISNVRVESVSQRSEKKNVLHGTTTESILGKTNLAALTKPFLVHLKNGKTKAFYSYWAEPATIKNLKRGLVSLLQFQLHTGKIVENDVSGRCTVQYQATRGQVTRTKLLETCKTSDTGFTTHTKVLGVSKKSNSVTVFKLKDGFIESAEAEETHSLAVNSRRSAAAKVVSRQTLVLVGMEAGPFEAAGKDVAGVVKSIDGKLAAVGVVAEKVKSQCRGCPSLLEHWQAVQKQLEPASLSKATAPRSFLALLQSIRKASKDEILKVLKSASKTSLPQVVDAVTSSQTPASLDAMLEFLNFTDAKGLVLQERFLYACGFASHPNERMLQALLNIYKGKIGSKDIKESVVIIMGALVHKLCLKGGCNLPTVMQVKKIILEGPESTKDEAEVQMYLLALKNSLLPESIPIFNRFAESEVGSYSTIALTALQRYDVSLITSEVKQTVNRVYHQNLRIYEKNVRAAAADVILSSNPSYMEVKNLLLSIGNLPHEMNKYMLSKIQDILRFEMPASKVIRRAMKDMISHNYNRFAKVGSSSAFSGFMAQSADVTSTYSLDILYSGSGILRRSNMNIYGSSNGAMLHGLQVAIEAQGLESLIAATPDEGEEDLESFAGMSALLFDVQLRPVTFFKGYSDLMSKMFSMTGDPINVVKGLILLTDHSEVVQLQSGLRASAEFQGGLAIDISGGMEISLWYRESKTSVNNRGALVVTGNVTVDMDFLRAGVEVSFETEASLDFITTVQFSEYPFLVCMQMDKATFPVSEYLSKYENVASGRSVLTRSSKKQLVPGSEFPLHQENSNMCKRVFDSSW